MRSKIITDVITREEGWEGRMECSAGAAWPNAPSIHWRMNYLFSSSSSYIPPLKVESNADPVQVAVRFLVLHRSVESVHRSDWVRARASHHPPIRKRASSSSSWGFSLFLIIFFFPPSFIYLFFSVFAFVFFLDHYLYSWSSSSHTQLEGIHLFRFKSAAVAGTVGTSPSWARAQERPLLEKICWSFVLFFLFFILFYSYFSSSSHTCCCIQTRVYLFFFFLFFFNYILSRSSV